MAPFLLPGGPLLDAAGLLLLDHALSAPVPTTSTGAFNATGEFAGVRVNAARGATTAQRGRDA